MKKNLILALAVVSVAVASMLTLGAMDSYLLKVNVPFAFQVDKASLPAGQYLVEIRRAGNASALGTALIIRTPDGEAQHMLATRPAHNARYDAALTFHKYSNTYFLASVESDGSGCQLNKSRAEKEIATKARAPEAVSVAAE